MSSDPPLSGCRVVDLSTWIAGAYATKLLADGGADVVKVESPVGDPLRCWSASGATIPPDDDGALFNFLGASKRSVVVDDGASVQPLLEGAEIVVWSRGSALTEHLALAPEDGGLHSTTHPSRPSTWPGTRRDRRWPHHGVLLLPRRARLAVVRDEPPFLALNPPVVRK